MDAIIHITTSAVHLGLSVTEAYTFLKAIQKPKAGLKTDRI